MNGAGNHNDRRLARKPAPCRSQGCSSRHQGCNYGRRPRTCAKNKSTMLYGSPELTPLRVQVQNDAVTSHSSNQNPFVARSPMYPPDKPRILNKTIFKSAGGPNGRQRARKTNVTPFTMFPATRAAAMARDRGHAPNHASCCQLAWASCLHAYAHLHEVAEHGSGEKCTPRS